MVAQLQRGSVRLVEVVREFGRGILSEDCTDGLGPEAYTVASAMRGTYRIFADCFADSSPDLLGPVTVHLTIITDFGRPTEQRTIQNVRLQSPEDVVEIGTVTIR